MPRTTLDRTGLVELVSGNLALALLRHENNHGPRPVVTFTVKGFLALTTGVPDDVRRLQHLSAHTFRWFVIATENPDMLPGWRFEIDDSAGRTRLRCTRTTPSESPRVASSA